MGLDSDRSDVSGAAGWAAGAGGADRRKIARAVPAARAGEPGRDRREGHATACDSEDSRAERELARAILAYKQASGRELPTWGEVVEILRGRGGLAPA